jgi:hypothetical protein
MPKYLGPFPVRRMVGAAAAELELVMPSRAFVAVSMP